MRTLIFCFLILLTACEVATDAPNTLPYEVGLPFYTTYAAAQERSSFVLDQGYALTLHRPDKALRMRSQRGGELGMDIFYEGRIISQPEEMFQPPVLTASYPDYAAFEWQPIEGLIVKNKTWVYSSRAIIQEYLLQNNREDTLALSLVPSLGNGYRPFREPEKKAGGRELVFKHEDYPDAWTLSHELPYTDSIINHWLLSEPADDWAGLNHGKDIAHVLPFGVMPEKSPIFQLNGRVLDQKGQRVLDRSPDLRMMAWWKDQPYRIITEQSPVLGLPEPAINTDGYYRMDLGQIGTPKEGRKYQLLWWHTPSESGGHYTETVPDDGKVDRKDLQLAENALEPLPIGEVRTNDGYTMVYFPEQEPGREIRIFERSYPNPWYDYKLTLEEDKFYVPLHADSLKGYIGVLWNSDRDEPESIPSKEFLNVPVADLEMWLRGSQHSALPAYSTRLSARLNWELEPGESRSFRMLRYLSPYQEDIPDLDALLALDFNSALDENKAVFSKVPALKHPNQEVQLLYQSAWNMMRQQFYPPEGRSSFNYYVFSREPTWGWGHVGQVFHESLTMLAYAWLDPISAMNSQRVYAERQYDNGYINYRTGSYLDEIIEYNGQLTSSAPWYAWINWEVYRMTGDKAFLEEMYSSSKRFYQFYVANRDADGDGLCEWGGHAILESVRDANVAVWDEVNWPSHFEALDLNSMLVMEAKSLEAMARELGLDAEANEWQSDYEKRSELIRKTFWDEETGFFYHVDRDSHQFTHSKENDLKRMEIIGFLPLWAGVANPSQAGRLVEHLTNPQKFWRTYGIPSLAADDPYYNDKGYWNGPVWVEWNYLLQRGLQDYGYQKEAAELVDKVTEGMLIQLKETNNLWEFYSPDEPWAGYHKTYIWAGIINRMLKDAEDIPRP
jgi:hypothetical protein